MDLALGGWSEFNIALAGAAAALAGLLIVAMSVNITAILKAATLPTRAAASIAALMLAVAASLLGLMPGQPAWQLGVWVLAGAVIVWVLEAFAIRAIVREPGQPWSARSMKVLVGVLSPLSFTAGAVSLIGGSLAGFAWVATGGIAAIIAAVLFSWIALVEILR